jgi:hypothetical protein
VTVSSALSEISKEELENIFWHGHGLTRRERPSVGDNESIKRGNPEAPPRSDPSSVIWLSVYPKSIRPAMFDKKFQYKT